MRRLQVTTRNRRPLMVDMVASSSLLSKLFSGSVLHFQRALFSISNYLLIEFLVYLIVSFHFRWVF